MGTVYRVVQPYSPVKTRDHMVISEHATAAEAFAAIDALSERMVRTGARSDAVEFIVVTDAVKLVTRPAAHCVPTGGAPSRHPFRR